MSGESARRTWRIEGAPATGDPAEVFLEAEVGSSTDDLLSEIDRLGFDASSGKIGPKPSEAGATLGSLGLRHGSTIAVGEQPEISQEDESRAGSLFVVLCGPDAGACFRLGESEQVVGRNRSLTISIADPLLSNQHLGIRMREGLVEVEDLG